MQLPARCQYEFSLARFIWSQLENWVGHVITLQNHASIIMAMLAILLSDVVNLCIKVPGKIEDNLLGDVINHRHHGTSCKHI